jgi:hypothetical protein
VRTNHEPNELTRTASTFQKWAIRLSQLIGALAIIFALYRAGIDKFHESIDAEVLVIITPYVKAFSKTIGAHDVIIKYQMDRDSSWEDFAGWKPTQDCHDALLRGDACLGK